QEGIRRSLHNLQSAELILLVVDGTALCGEDDADQIRRLAGRKAIVLRNKSDLGVRFVPPPEISQVLDISCSTGQGIEELKTAITRLVWSGKLGADMSDAMINSRHQDALRRAGVATEAAARVLQGEESLEIAAMELRIGLNAVGEITGKTSTEDLLDSIFSQFCIGK
ncbi:MAG: tRNA uridine-5-carboxymethylaminomethyl(34) synthesis GTPase MnmE, partial [Verrucomicrobia bacterium]|nr:tRNA uridine-5-carboxymethylaminomethyl(34) synthesis GTPase MnmE [Verrucomicrobiota bacterium]